MSIVLELNKEALIRKSSETFFLFFLGSIRIVNDKLKDFDYSATSKRLLGSNTGFNEQNLYVIEGYNIKNILYMPDRN